MKECIAICIGLALPIKSPGKILSTLMEILAWTF